MKKGEKILIGVLVGIALINFYLQHRTAKKTDELHQSIKEKI
jgi:hypothetical protein